MGGRKGVEQEKRLGGQDGVVCVCPNLPSQNIGRHVKGILVHQCLEDHECPNSASDSCGLLTVVTKAHWNW